MSQQEYSESRRSFLQSATTGTSIVLASTLIPRSVYAGDRGNTVKMSEGKTRYNIPELEHQETTFSKDKNAMRYLAIPLGEGLTAKIGDTTLPRNSILPEVYLAENNRIITRSGNFNRKKGKIEITSADGAYTFLAALQTNPDTGKLEMAVQGAPLRASRIIGHVGLIPDYKITEKGEYILTSESSGNQMDLSTFEVGKTKLLRIPMNKNFQSEFIDSAISPTEEMLLLRDASNPITVDNTGTGMRQKMIQGVVYVPINGFAVHEITEKLDKMKKSIEQPTFGAGGLGTIPQNNTEGKKSRSVWRFGR